VELLVYPSDEVLARATEKLNAALEREFGGSTLLLLAGGSSLALLEGVKKEFLGAHLTIGMSDERAGDDPRANNFVQMTQTVFYRKAEERGCAFFDTKQGETAAQLGVRMDGALRAWRAENPRGAILLTQGIGADGHTCGIMPFPEDEKKFAELFETAGRFAVGYDASGKSEFAARATVTMTFLRGEVSESVAYAVGSSKKNALSRLMDSKRQALHKVPAWILRDMKTATVFTDQQA
jgi:6-phosphogluconolactonase/glucosamine-6-phosphate isomerase/deaminase